MIAICPACGKRYRVADAAVPVTGREVRCAACRHGWTVWPDGATTPATAEATPLSVPLPEPPPAEPPPHEPPPPKPAPPAPPPVPTTDVSPATEAQSAWSPDPDPVPRRRYGLLVATALIAVVVTAAAVVEFAPADTFDPPRLGLPSPRDLARQTPSLDLPPLDLRQIPLIGDALDGAINPPPAPASPLRVTAHGERRTLANGTNILLVSGTVTNSAAAPVALTAIDAVLRDPAGPVAIRWRIPAPVAMVAGHGSVAFESVAANFPAAATVLQLTPR